jgi:hypothetical protein
MEHSRGIFAAAADLKRGYLGGFKENGGKLKTKNKGDWKRRQKIVKIKILGKFANWQNVQLE